MRCGRIAMALTMARTTEPPIVRGFLMTLPWQQSAVQAWPTCQGPGSTSIIAFFQATSYSVNCNPNTFTTNPGGTMSVRPNITSLDVTRGAVGQAYNINITGTGFGSSPSVSVGGSGVTVSGTTPSDGRQVSTTFTFAENATGGNHGVTVMASGQTSNSVNFYVQIPRK